MRGSSAPPGGLVDMHGYLSELDDSFMQPPLFGCYRFYPPSLTFFWFFFRAPRQFL